MSDLFKRLGIVKVSDVLFRESPEILLEIFKEVLITDVKYDSKNSIWHYRGFSKYFDIVEEGAQVPEYIALVTDLYSGFGEKADTIIEWKKQETQILSKDDFLNEIENNVIKLCDMKYTKEEIGTMLDNILLQIKINRIN